MKTLTVGELKSQFSAVLTEIAKNGEPVAISFGRRKQKVAAIIPFDQLKTRAARPLGIMQGRGKCVIHDDFAMTDDELLKA